MEKIAIKISDTWRCEGEEIYFCVVDKFLGLIGCTGTNGGNQQTDGDMLDRRPSVAFEGTGIADPTSEL